MRHRRQIPLLVAVALSLATAVAWFGRTRATKKAFATKPVTALTFSPSPAGAAAAQGVNDIHPQVVPLRELRLPRLAYAQAWGREVPPAMVAFRAWAERFLATAPAARTALEAEGVTLAHARRPVMLAMIKTDPQRALAVTVPAVVRQQLPSSVLAEIESRVSGRGDYMMLYATPPPGAADATCSASRIAFVGGITYAAHPYGRREAQFAKHGASLHGIALDRELALHESPVRILELEESETTTGANAIVEAFGRTREFSTTSDDLLEIARKLDLRGGGV